MYANNEILFPNYVIPTLRNMRGPEWAGLIDRDLIRAYKQALEDVRKYLKKNDI